MWKPQYVVKEHKLRANLVWAILLAAILGFTVYQSAKMALKRRNPDTRFEDDVFQFPYLEVCFLEGRGCDTNWDPSACIETVRTYMKDSCDNEVNASVVSQYVNCVAFDLEKIDLDGFVECADEFKTKPSIYLEMGWTTSFDTGGESKFRSSVLVFLGGPVGGQLTNVPYSRLVLSDEDSASEARIGFTEMTIGKNVRKRLSGSSDVSYPTLTISTTDYVYANQSILFGKADNTTDGGELSAGFLDLSLALGSFALTELSDIDPTEVLDLISSIGGFWGLLVGVWGFFFIATVDNKPEQKARNFKKDMEKGKRLLRRKGSSPKAVASDAQAGDDERPNWDIAHGGPLEAIGNTNGDRVPEIENAV